MNFSHLSQRVARLEGIDSLLKAIRRPHGVGQVEGISGPAKSLLLAYMLAKSAGPTVIITWQNDQVQRIYDDLHLFGIPENRLFTMPVTESLRMSDDVTDHRSLGERILALTSLAKGDACVVIGTSESIFQRTSPSNELLSTSFDLCSGMCISPENLLPRLVDLGYESTTTVNRPGEFSRRGGVLDIYPCVFERPIRLDYFGDEIESIRYFDVTSQRSAEACELVQISPAREIRLTNDNIENAIQAIQIDLHERKKQLAGQGNRPAYDLISRRVEADLSRLQNGVYFDGLEEYLPYLVPTAACSLDYIELPDNALVVMDEPGQIQLQIDRIGTDSADNRLRSWERGETLQGATFSRLVNDPIKRTIAQFPTLVLAQLSHQYSGINPAVKLAVSSSPMDSYRSRLEYFADEVQTWLDNSAECIVISDQPGRVREICSELKLQVSSATSAEMIEPRNNKNSLIVLEGRLRQGLKFADIGLYLATDAELFGSARANVVRRRATGGIPISTILDLREGDYVVHVQHGIGLYRGLVKREIEGAARDFLFVQYEGGSLYIPADQIDRVQRYIGGGDTPPVINRIGGNDWQRTTRKVKEQARSIARELIQLYAARQAAERPSFGPDTLWQREMEDAFPYTETPGQMHAIEDVKEDMEGFKPMDRLVCGDVGFGKTEVAIRAAFKALSANKQVAILCPTTVLAAQHHTTFSERLAAYPINVELLSRFRKPAQQRETLHRLRSGVTDIVIGTHRLLSKDVEFSNLGLIVVDEEQRFGVTHKERLKHLRTSVDVLTLTATPIPRTLSMALSGLRDMSVIEDPPGGRLPIITYVREFDDDIVRDALQRELAREGQVYFVHNRIESIDHVAERVQRLVPEARICIGHGQMSEDELEKIMFDFYHHNYDILICTTIIENGLDVSCANTLIIDRADHMGLSQLYQLRGRVGRSNRQAYAYLLYRRNKQLTEVAERRLMAIKQFTALGSGFQIAMRDLEIRGAGNLLGSEQSGAMVTVGYDLYCQLLADAVAEEKGVEPKDESLPPVDLPVTAHIPDEYIPNEAERIYFYKKMSAIRSHQDIDELREELEDRYGDPPAPVWTALSVLQLRLRCQMNGITAMRGEGQEIHLRFNAKVRMTPDALKRITQSWKKLRFTGDSVIFSLTGPKLVEQAEQMLAVLENAFKLSQPKRMLVRRRPSST